MIKHNKGLIILFVMALFLIIFPKNASAEEDLEISNWIVDAYLQESGDLWISEDITFDFNDKFNGVFRDVVMDKTSGISEINVSNIENNTISEYAMVSKAKNGDKEVFTIEEKKNKVIVKIFSPSRNEKKTFRISYIMKNVAVQYKDTGELYYKFLGNENKTSIKNFIVNINLPYEDNDNRVKIFAHGPLDGKINQINKKQFQLKVDNVPSRTFVEGRILFPSSFIKESNNIHNINRYQEIIDEEAAYITKLEQDRQSKEDAKNLFKKISLLMSSISILSFAIILYQNRRNISSDILNIEYSDIPDDCTPAVASLISGALFDNNVIFATILDLFRKGYLRIESKNISQDVRKNKNYILYRTREGDMSLLKHERYFMNWLFDSIGTGESVTTKNIQDYNNKNSQKFYNSQKTWKNMIMEAAKEYGYYDNTKTSQGGLLITLSLIGIVLGFVTAILGSIYSLLSFGVNITLLIYGINCFYRLSDKGYIQHKKWNSLKKHMKKQSPDLSMKEALDSLDTRLIYALSLNVVKKMKTNKSLEDDYSTNSWVFWYIMFSSSTNNSFRESINSSFVINSSSSTNGGFSSGGGGGAGGGGAGGF